MGRRAHVAGVDPGRPARGELRHLHGRRGRARLRRQRLRRGLPRDASPGTCSASPRAWRCWAGPRRCRTATSPASSSATRGPTSTRCTPSSTATATPSGRCAWAPPRGAVEAALLAGAAGHPDRPARPRSRWSRTTPGASGTAPACAPLDDAERAVVVAAYDEYLDDDPAGQAAEQPHATTLKDVVGLSGFGIGSAGLPAYNAARRGRDAGAGERRRAHDEAGRRAGAEPARADEQAQRYFEHEGHRTAVSQRALQAHSDPWLGWARMAGGPHDGVGFLVKEFSPYEADLDWAGADRGRRDDRGRRAARPGHRQGALRVRRRRRGHAARGLPDRGRDRGRGRRRARTSSWPTSSAFGLAYGAPARADHALFVDAFRNGRIPGVCTGCGAAHRGGQAGTCPPTASPSASRPCPAAPCSSRGRSRSSCRTARSVDLRPAGRRAVHLPAQPPACRAATPATATKV